MKNDGFVYCPATDDLCRKLKEPEPEREQKEQEHDRPMAMVSGDGEEDEFAREQAGCDSRGGSERRQAARVRDKWQPFQ